MERRVLAAVVFSLSVLFTCSAVAGVAEQLPVATPPESVPFLQQVTRLIVFLMTYGLFGTMVGKFFVSDFQWTPGDLRETATFGIALVLSFATSAILSLTPSIGPYLGSIGAADVGRGAGEFVLGVAFYWSTVVCFVVLVFQLISVVTQSRYETGPPRFFALLLSIGAGQYIHTRLLNVVGLPTPDKDGFAAFFTATIGKVNVAGISTSSGFGLLSFQPIHAVISLVDRTIHDIGCSIVLSSLLFYFAYSFLTFGVRRSARIYQKEIAWASSVYSDTPQLLAEEMSRIQARHAVGCLGLSFLNAAKVLFLVGLYYFFVNATDFRNIQSALPVTDLASPPRGFVILSLAGFSVWMQAFLQSHSQMPVPVRLFGALFPAGIVVACAYFAPAGLVLVLTTITFADAVQSLYESRLPRESLMASLTPALVIIPLAVALIPRGTSNPSERSVAAMAVPAAPIPVAPLGPGNLEPETNADVGKALVDRVGELTKKSDFKQALDLIEAELAERPDNQQFKGVKIRTLEEYGVKQLSDRQKVGAVKTLEEVYRLEPKNENVAALLATIYVEAGEEDLRGACVRNEPSAVAPVLMIAGLGDVLTRRAVDPIQGWVPVDAQKGVSGWIREMLVDAGPTATQIQVKRTMPRDEVYKSLEAAMELSPKVRNKVLWIKYKMLLVPAGILLAVVYVGWRKFAGL